MSRNILSNVKFTFDWYDTLIDRLLDGGYAIKSYGESANNNSVILRHDVDWSPRKAVTLAEIEAERNVSSSFFFLLSSPFYNVLNTTERQYIERIGELGHNIGVHFDTQQYWDEQPDDEKVRQKVLSQQRILGEIIDDPDDIVSFHNPPEWIYRQNYESFTSTYEPRFFDKIKYVADSNQRWRDASPFADGFPDEFQLLTHPVLWGKQDAQSSDRLREERDFHEMQIAKLLNQTNRTWENQFGIQQVRNENVEASRHQRKDG